MSNVVSVRDTLELALVALEEATDYFRYSGRIFNLTAADEAIKQAKRKALLEAINFDWPLDRLTKILVQEILHRMVNKLR